MDVYIKFVTHAPLAPALINNTVTDLTKVLTIISCTSSIIGALAIFAIYLKCPSIRTTSKELIVYLSVADLLTASGNLVGIVRYISTEANASYIYAGNSSDPLCIGQSVVTTYSSMCSFFWTAAISFFILMPVARRYMFGRKFHVSCHVMCWFVPGIIVTTAACRGKLGEDRAHTSGGWCWINGSLPPSDRLAWMIFTGKGWELSVYIITAVNYILLRYLWYKRQHAVPWPPIIHYEADERYTLKQEDKNFLYVPVLLYLLRFWGTIRFVLSFCGDNGDIDTVSSVLQPLHGLGDSGQAFWNFIVFFLLDSSVRSKLCIQAVTDSELGETTLLANERTPLITENRDGGFGSSESRAASPQIGDHHGYTIS